MRGRPRLLVALVLGGAALGAATEGDAPEPLDALLVESGVAQADLGFRGSAVGTGFPGAERVAFRLAVQERLLADPLAAPGWALELGRQAEALGAEPSALLRTLAIRPRLPAFAEIERPFADDAGSDPSRTCDLPEPLRAPVARLVAGLLEADALVRRAWRDVPPEVAREAAALPGLTGRVADAAPIPAALSTAARTLDRGAMARAGVVALAAVERAARELRPLLERAPADAFRGLRWSFPTPAGPVVVSGAGGARHRAKGAPPLALVDLGGRDSYRGAFAAARFPERAVSVVLDLGGDDDYGGADGAQGSGLGGVGILWDAAGSDRYVATSRAQGYAQLGVGVLVDEGGRDAYRLDEAGQGAALFGSALLLDRSGDDDRRILRDGQGWGGPDGAGVLVDLEGNDRYEAVRDARVAGRPDPRADGLVTTSNAQGIGVGRRGDLSDGVSWAGGLGALLDLSGNDVFAGGTFCQGAGYFFGLGLLLDAAGDDRHEAVWYAQGSAAHAAVGVLVDAEGRDAHALVPAAAGRTRGVETGGGAGLGFGWHFAAGLFADLGGDDRYGARRLALGAAQRRATGLFVDVRGDDVYDAAEEEHAFGAVDDDASWAERDPAAPAWHDAAQAGLFLDLAGADAYPAISRAANRSRWSWNRGAPRRAPRNVGAGMDAEGRAVPAWLRIR